MTKTDGSVLRVLVFRVGSLRCAVPLDATIEVLPWLVTTRIPRVDPVIRGVANVRGGLLTVIDGRALLAQDHSAPPDSVVVLRAAGRPVGVEVDELEDILTVAVESFGLAERLPGLTTTAPVASKGMAGEFEVALLDVEMLMGPVFAESVPSDT